MDDISSTTEDKYYYYYWATQQSGEEEARFSFHHVMLHTIVFPLCKFNLQLNNYPLTAKFA